MLNAKTTEVKNLNNKSMKNNIKQGIIALLFIIISALATIASDTAKTINAADYGLKEGIDNTPAFIRALDACREQKATKLIIPKGTYDIFPERANEKYIHVTNNDDGLKRIVFMLHGFNNLEIDGMGSKLTCHDHMLPFDLQESKNIAIRNLSIDWAMPFNFQARVIAVHPDENAFDIEVYKECIYEIQGNKLIFTNKKRKVGDKWIWLPAREQKEVRWEQDMTWSIWWNTQTKAPVLANEGPLMLWDWNVKRGLPATAVEIGEDTVRLTNANNQLPEVGWISIIKGKREPNRLSSAIHINQCKDIEIHNVTVHHAAGIALIVERTENVTMNSYNVVLPPNSDRLITSTADASHFLNCKGLIQFENCKFENMLDDATNVHGSYVDVEEVTGEYTLGMTRGHNQQQGTIFAGRGDKIKLLNKNSLNSYATLTVESVKNVNSFYFEVTFKENVKNILQESTLAENLSWQPDVEIKNCTVRNNRARSLLISTSGDVLIENNHFSNCTYTGILIPGHFDFWYESGPVKNVTIRNNVFEDLGLSVGNAPFIDIGSNLKADTKPPFYFHSNIVVENNTINTFGRLLVKAVSVDNLQLRNNTINRSKNYPVVSPEEGPAFIIDRCNNVLIDGNNYKWGNTATIESKNTTGLIVKNNKNIDN